MFKNFVVVVVYLFSSTRILLRIRLEKGLEFWQSRRGNSSWSFVLDFFFLPHASGLNCVCVVRVDCSRKEGLATFILPFFYYKKGKNLTKKSCQEKEGGKEEKRFTTSLLSKLMNLIIKIFFLDFFHSKHSSSSKNHRAWNWLKFFKAKIPPAYAPSSWWLSKIIGFTTAEKFILKYFCTQLLLMYL